MVCIIKIFFHVCIFVVYVCTVLSQSFFRIKENYFFKIGVEMRGIQLISYWGQNWILVIKLRENIASILNLNILILSVLLLYKVQLTLLVSWVLWIIRKQCCKMFNMLQQEPSLKTQTSINYHSTYIYFWLCVPRTRPMVWQPFVSLYPLFAGSDSRLTAQHI